jgi:predicted alpha/beta superfamily hydrolase
MYSSRRIPGVFLMGHIREGGEKMTTQSTQNKWTEARPTPIANIVGYEFDSQLVGDRFAITVATPPLYEATTEPVPTLYVLDQSLTLTQVVGQSRALGAVSFGHFPQTLVVGIGYPLAPPAHNVARRNRDLTPTTASFLPGIPGMITNVSLGLGGGPRFLRCLIEEVIPGIEARYRVHPTDRTLIGVSLSGLFGLSVLSHRPETFARYLLISPPIWWDNAICFSYEETWAKEHTDLPARVFCAVGELEEVPDRQWPPELGTEETMRLARTVSNLQELTGHLSSRGYPSLTVESVVFPDEHHITVFPAALSRGLVRLFTGTGEH